MFGLPTRILLISLLAAVAFLQIRAGHWVGWVAIAGALLLVWGYLRYGTIHAAFQAHLKGDDEAVVQLLAQTKVTAFLRPQDRTYFDFLSGTVAQKQGKLEAARESFQRAGLGPLRTDNMRSVIYCHLAAVEIAAERPQAAAENLEKARACPHRAETDEMIAQLETAIAEASPS